MNFNVGNEAVKTLTIFAVAWMLTVTVQAERIATLDRLFDKAKVSGNASPIAHLKAVRQIALEQSVVSDPVSDRYLVTELGGPIDLVHFLGLAIQALERPKNRDEALWAQYVEEGGLDHEKGMTRRYLVEAHPDDLPSNAFGALFGSEFIGQNDTAVRSALTDLLSKLKPLPDSIVKRYSHAQIVMGLNGTESGEVARSRREWFTARPLLVAQSLGLSRKISEIDALQQAGFALVPIRGREIKIVRVPNKSHGGDGGNVGG